MNIRTGPLGFEPRNVETKTRCLTTWRRPIDPFEPQPADHRSTHSYPQQPTLRQSTGRIKRRPISGGKPSAVTFQPHRKHRCAVGNGALGRPASGEHACCEAATPQAGLAASPPVPPQDGILREQPTHRPETPDPAG